LFWAAAYAQRRYTAEKNMSNNYIIGISTLIIGWVLGILSNVVNEKLKRRNTKIDTINGIKSELDELQIHLSTVSMMSVFEINEFDEEYYNWVKPYYFKSLDSVQSIIPKDIQEKLKEFKELDDEHIFNMLKTIHVSDPEDSLPKTFTYQNITIPFIDSKIKDISLLSPESQRLLLVIKRDINFLNSDYSQVWYYHTKTFEQPSEANLDLINANLKNLYRRIGNRAKVVVNNIEKINKIIS